MKESKKEVGTTLSKTETFQLSHFFPAPAQSSILPFQLPAAMHQCCLIPRGQAVGRAQTSCSCRQPQPQEHLLGTFPALLIPPLEKKKDKKTSNFFLSSTKLIGGRQKKEQWKVVNNKSRKQATAPGEKNKIKSWCFQD